MAESAIIILQAIKHLRLANNNYLCYKNLDKYFIPFF